MNRLSSQNEQRIIECWFQGTSRDEIADKLGVSGSTVSVLIDSLPACLTPLRDLAKDLRKLGCDPKDALAGLALRRTLLELGVTSEQISLLIAGYRKVSSAHGCEVEKLTHAATRLTELENHAGTHYEEALSHFENLNLQNAELESKNASLMIEIRENEARRVETLELANVSPQEASEYRKLRFEFKKRRLNLQDAEAVKSFVDNMKQSGFSPNRFVAMGNRNDLIKKLLRENEIKLNQLQADLSLLQSFLEAKREEANFLENQVTYLRDQEQKSRYALDIQYGQRCRLQSECNELNLFKNELIAQIGQIAGMGKPEINSLQIESHVELIKAIVEARFKESLRKLS